MDARPWGGLSYMTVSSSHVLASGDLGLVLQWLYFGGISLPRKIFGHTNFFWKHFCTHGELASTSIRSTPTSNRVGVHINHVLQLDLTSIPSRIDIESSLIQAGASTPTRHKMSSWYKHIFRVYVGVCGRQCLSTSVAGLFKCYILMHILKRHAKRTLDCRKYNG